MTLCMTISYRLQATQMIKKLPYKLSLDSTLTHHLHDEKPKLQEVRLHIEIEPLQIWYYRIFPNSHTLVILLQVDPISGDEPKTVYEVLYQIKNISIFAWFSIFDVGHYHWLHSLICRIPLNKAYYLVHTIKHILDFL